MIRQIMLFVVEYGYDTKEVKTMNAQENSTIYQFPPLSLLKKGQLPKYDAELLKETALMIQQTLQNFGIRITIVDINVGTRFTRYGLHRGRK